MKIGVLWRPERNINLEKEFVPEDIEDDAFEEGHQHAQALEESGHETVMLQWHKDPAETIQRIKDENVDFVFNAASDEEVSLLEIMGIPFAGSGMDLTPTDKAVRKQVVSYHGLPTAKFVVVRDPQHIPPVDHMSYPLFVKALRGRGSACISEENIIENREELERMVEKVIRVTGQAALVEEFIEGREFTVGIIGHGEDLSVLPILEVEYNGVRTNTYEHKMDDVEIIHCPGRFSPNEEKNIVETAKRIFSLLNARDYGRMDMIMGKDGKPYFLELNTFAGLTKAPEEGGNYVHNSYMGYMAEAAGMTRKEFIGGILDSALIRCGLKEKPTIRTKEKMVV